MDRISVLHVDGCELIKMIFNCNLRRFTAYLSSVINDLINVCSHAFVASELLTNDDYLALARLVADSRWRCVC